MLKKICLKQKKQKIFRFGIFLIIMLSLIIVTTEQAHSQNADDNLEILEDEKCDGKIKLRTERYNSGNTIGDHLWVQYQKANNDWHTIFHTKHYMDGGNKYTQDVYDGCEDMTNCSNCGDGEQYWWDYYFNLEVVEPGLYNSVVKIRAVESGDGTISDDDSFYELECNPIKPGKATGLTTDADDCESVTLSWTEPSNMTTCPGAWNVYNDDDSYIGSTGETTYDITGGSGSYKVRYDTDDGGQGFMSNTASGDPLGGGDPPSGATASDDLCDGKVLFTWEWYESNPESFIITRGSTTIATVSGDIREYEDTGLEDANTDYIYTVGAGDICGDVNFSSEAIGKYRGDPAKANMTSANGNGNSITVNWGGIYEFDDMQIVRTMEDGGVSFVLDQNTTSYTDNEAGGCQTYTYRIETSNHCGTTISDNEVSARIDPDLSGTFNSGKRLVCSKGYFSDKILLKWEFNFPNIVERFKVYRQEYGVGTRELIATIDPTTSYMDETAEAGIYYEYSIVAETDCESDIIASNEDAYSRDIGFRVPLGTVAGEITYPNGVGVEDVSVLAETEDEFTGYGMHMNGADSRIIVPHNAGFDFSSGFTFQAWIKPSDSPNTTRTLFQKGSQYKLEYDDDDIIFTAGTHITILNFTQKEDTFFCVNAVRDADSIYIYVLYDELTIYTKSVKLVGGTPTNSSPIIIGGAPNFNGYIEEVRVWNKGLSKKDVINTGVRYIAGNEEDLELYLRLNETFYNTVYDISRVGANYNERHGTITNCSLSETVPLPRQLSVKGISNANGNYLVTGIPYTEGSVYTMVPIFEVHEFDPHSKSLYIGPGASVHNGINFIDLAAFKIQGNVKYKNTYFPVSEVNFYIDGRLQMNPDGSLIQTDNMGNYELYVPIGWHHFEVKKQGHVFKDEGRFPAEDEYNFQEPISNLNFTDITLVKVIGRVTGGPIQAAKPKGLGKTDNNIGHAEIIMTTEKEYDLAMVDSTGTWQNQSYEDDNLIDKGETSFYIDGLNPKSIKIYPNHETGEFFAYLLPEKYYMTSAKAGNLSGTQRYTFNENSLLSLDLKNVIMVPQTEIDSVVINEITMPDESIQYVYRIDSVEYHWNCDLIYREIPDIQVVNRDEEPNFWESEIELKDGTLLTVINEDGTPKTDFPVFKQRERYYFKVSVFEEYINVDDNDAEDIVPVTDGTVDIVNLLAIHTDRKTFQIDKNGNVYYAFSAGLPKTTTGGVGDYLKTMEVIAYTGMGGVITTPWLYNGDTFKGYVIGGMPTGNNFVTNGPKELDMILRDPPGTNSYSYFEEGSSVSKTTTRTVTNEMNQNVSLTVMFGAKVTTFHGLGSGVIMENEANNDLVVGIESNQTWINENTTSTTFTNTKRWETSAEEDYVGSGGDVYIGHSTNIVYGKCTFIDLLAPDEGEGHVGSSVDGYRIGKFEGIRMNPEFATAFQFSQNHIKSYLIPNLKMLRNNYLANSDNYVSHYTQENPMYASDNTELPVSNDGYTFIGDSYNFTIPVEWDMDSLFTDTVWYFNRQIKEWQDIIKQNEKEKINSILEQNMSFDAGVVYENSTTHDTTDTHTSTFEWMISPSISKAFGFAFQKVGMRIDLAASYTHTETDVNQTDSTHSVTFGYVLNDGNAGDYLSIDIKTPKAHTSTVFRTRGGQTMCPYEGEEVTEFYQPGTVLNSATMQREIPQILALNTIANNIPEDEPAIFNIELSNLSETEEAQWFLISIDHSSNQCGTFISMDGADMGSGVTLLLHPNESIMKSIYFEKVQPEAYDCEDIGIVFGSVCQNDPTSLQDNIADTIRLTAHWQPVCANVTLNNPENQWVVNTNGDTTINIGISEYDLSNDMFEKISLKSKSASTSNWAAPKMTFYVNEEDYNNASEPKTYINGVASMNYIYDLKDMQDRNYDIKLQTNCSDGTINDSEIASGIKDVKRPQLFGAPQPADGILSPGDEVMITFDEDIYQGGLTPYNFSVRGVINQFNELRHNACIFFDGTDDYASIVRGTNLDNKPFTIEFWTRRGESQSGIVYSQGDIEIGFNANNKFYVKIGSETFLSDASYTDFIQWMHFAVTFDAENSALSVYMNDGIVISEAPVGSPFSSQGRMYIGKNQDGTNFYNGYIHDFRIWKAFRSFGTSYADMMKVMTGNEIKLAGLWAMDEAYGDKAEDKARSQHALLVGAEWQVFPAGYARTFNGAGEHIDFTTGSTVVITENMDCTIEFWFKGEEQTNTVMFSNGHDNFQEQSPPFDNVWVIGSNSNGEIYAKNKGTAITIEEENFFDNSWHHFTMVVNRRGNTSLYIDGEMKAYEISTMFGGLVGAEMSIAARRHYVSEAVIDYDNHFNGKIDELRIWGLAKTKKQILMDRNCKLQGNEMGLYAYYPFEKYDYLGENLIPTLEDWTFDFEGKQSGLEATNIGGDITNTDVPKIKDARPVQELAFDWVVNEDKIIVNINESPAAVEKCILEFTVDRVEDLRENRMASPATWTAYIKKNAIIWEEVQLDIEKIVFEDFQFQATILNTGGTDESYQISNIPAWLSVSEQNGTIPPDSYKTLTFTVDPVVNVGNYDLSLYLTSEFGYKEKLNVNLKVYEQSPTDWTVEGGNFENSMNIMGQLKINNKFSISPDDKVAAFVMVNGTEECRGVVNSNYIEDYDMFYVFLTIYSNNTSGGENIYFKIWDANTGQVHIDITPFYEFEMNAVHGSVTNPVIISTNNALQHEEVAPSGWKWMSFNLENPTFASVNNTLASLEAQTGDQIKTLDAFDSYDQTYGWNGMISNTDGFKNELMYKLKLTNPDTLIYSGIPLYAPDVPLTVYENWNYIGFPPQVNITVSDAFATYPALNEDLVKSQYAFAMYDDILGWIGDLEYLIPGHGYMLKTSNTEVTFTFPESGMKVASGLKNGYKETNIEQWQINKELYQHSMSIVGELDLNNTFVTEEHIIGAFVNDECRAVTKPVYIESQGKMLYFLTLYANIANEEITFKVINDKNEITDIIETVNFVSNNITGNLNAPFPFTIEQNVTGITENLNKASEFFISNYPNPFKDEITISYGLPNETEISIEVFDVLGKKVKTFDGLKNTAGIWTIHWNTGDIKSGVYFVKIKAGEFVKISEIVKVQ